VETPKQALRDGEGLIGEKDRSVGHLPQGFVDLRREVTRRSERITIHQVQ